MLVDVAGWLQPSATLKPPRGGDAATHAPFRFQHPAIVIAALGTQAAWRAQAVLAKSAFCFHPAVAGYLEGRRCLRQLSASLALESSLLIPKPRTPATLIAAPGVINH